MKKKLMALVLCALMVISLVPAMALVSSAAGMTVKYFQLGKYGDGGETWPDADPAQTQLLVTIPTDVWNDYKSKVTYTPITAADVGTKEPTIEGGKIEFTILDIRGTETKVTCVPANVGGLGTSSILRMMLADHATPKVPIEEGNVYAIYDMKLYVGNEVVYQSINSCDYQWKAGNGNQASIFVGGKKQATNPKVDTDKDAAKIEAAAKTKEATIQKALDAIQAAKQAAEKEVYKIPPVISLNHYFSGVQGTNDKGETIAKSDFETWKEDINCIIVVIPDEGGRDRLIGGDADCADGVTVKATINGKAYTGKIGSNSGKLGAGYLFRIALGITDAEVAALKPKSYYEAEFKFYDGDVLLWTGLLGVRTGGFADEAAVTADDVTVYGTDGKTTKTLKAYTDAAAKTVADNIAAIEAANNPSGGDQKPSGGDQKPSGGDQKPSGGNTPSTGDAVVYATIAMAVALVGMVVVVKKVRQ